MSNHDFSRRSLVLGATGLMAASASAQKPKPALTVSKVIERIKPNVGVPWREQTVDGVITGSPDTPVTGIATTMMATLDVMQRAAAAGRNLVITHEPTFYSHQDSLDQLKDDAVYRFHTDHRTWRCTFLGSLVRHRLQRDRHRQQRR